MVGTMTVEHNPDHIAEGQALPIYDLRKTKLQALLASYLEQVQDVEDAFWSLYFGLMIDDAEGDALDMLGALVGEARQGRTDDVYRVWILARARVHRSNGKPEELIAIMRLVCDSTIEIALFEWFPATIQIRLTGAVDATLAAQVAGLMQEAKAQGIALEMYYGSVPIAGTFTLGAFDTYDTTSTGTGLANAALTTGGRLTGIL